ncbi:hypothetical protein M378DRAFT_166998 [Amanita muscaria Koide BX008]|uniref:F-box domain-containing protein n=1 Tax=Amanita muscaria (strain Koide BX008) TaxID=946122 RepID=A0A0C2WY75_AMAMK|nr:hypothetical protein M378DRAFT_166998 [Amanita muscaria Koide BX008]
MTTAFSFDEDMPTELIAQILSHLDFHSMLKCRAVCSKFQYVIDSSPHYHWKSELALAGMEDGYNYSLASSREMLAEHQAGWNNLRWTNEEWVQIHEHGYWELCGNVLAQQSEDGSALQFMRLPSKSREVTVAKWTVHGKIFQMHDFCIDPSQDLLIVIEQPFWDQNDFMCRIFLWTLSTGEPHPLVAETHVLTHVLQVKQNLMVEQHVTGICGDALGILFEHVNSDVKEFVFWNWKTGEIIAHITADYVRSFTFLSERHVMLGDHIQPALVVVDIVAEDPKLQTLDEVENAFTFHFPSMAVGADVLGMKIRSDPAPGWKPGSVPFFTARHNHLVFINILIHRRDSATGRTEVSLYALSSSFLSLIRNATAQKSEHFDWLSWGPEGSRMTLYHFRLLEHWMRYVYGTRHVSSRWLPEASYIYMYDFNQLALRWSQDREKSSDVSLGSGRDKGYTPDEPGEGEAEAYINVTEPTKITDCEIFEGEVESRLGYRMKRWPAPRNRSVRTVMCTEDGIVLVYGNDTEETYHIMTV